jgi:hypothetical protein
VERRPGQENDIAFRLTAKIFEDVVLSELLTFVPIVYLAVF